MKRVAAAEAVDQAGGITAAPGIQIRDLLTGGPLEQTTSVLKSDWR